MLTLLVFVGQVTATAINPCKMDMSNQQSSHNNNMPMAHDMSNMSASAMSSMEHSAHTMVNPENLTQPDCCDSDTNCSMGGCISVVASSLDSAVDRNIVSTIIIFHTFSITSQIATSLYRPPIIG